MQNLNINPIKIKIPGEYYDTQIYSGRLYLWKLDGSIDIIDWDRLISSIPIHENLKLAIECSFLQSSYLYGSKWNNLFYDDEIREILIRKFQLLSEEDLEISKELLYSCLIKTQENKMIFPHSDCLIYNNELFVSGKRGVMKAKCNKKNVNPINPNSIKKFWDCPTLGLSASYSTLAISGGSEGLYEYQTDDLLGSEPNLIDKNYSNSSRWVYYSIFSSAYESQGYLVDYFGERKNNYTERTFKEIIPASNLFSMSETKNGNEFTWGLHDKICHIKNNTIEILRYMPWKESQRFEELGRVELLPFKGDIVACDSSTFGFVIECDNGIIVMDSNLKNIWIPEEPINWRVFPRSKHYENQLHIVYDDYVEILSFNHDYFVDQGKKLAGIKSIIRY